MVDLLLTDERIIAICSLLAKRNSLFVVVEYLSASVRTQHSRHEHALFQYSILADSGNDSVFFEFDDNSLHKLAIVGSGDVEEPLEPAFERVDKLQAHVATCEA
jgi:hypothetical protein